MITQKLWHLETFFQRLHDHVGNLYNKVSLFLIAPCWFPMVKSFQLMEKKSIACSVKLQSGVTFFLFIVRSNWLFELIQMGGFMLRKVLFFTQKFQNSLSYIVPMKSLKRPKCKGVATIDEWLLKNYGTLKHFVWGYKIT